MRNITMLVVAGIILLGGMSFPLKADSGIDDRLATESLRDLYIVTESLELGVEPLYRITGSGKVDNMTWYNLTFNHIMNVNTSFKINLGYMSYEVISSNLDTIGEVKNIVFRPTIIQSLRPYNKTFVPFLGGGLNFYRSYDQKSLLPGFKMWLHRDYAWGAHLATGIRYQPKENVTISLDIFRDWQLSNIKVKRGYQGRSPYDPRGGSAYPGASVNLNLWAIGPNFCFRF